MRRRLTLSVAIALRLLAAEVFLSEATVTTHLLHIYAKVGVNDRAAAVAIASEGSPDAGLPALTLSGR